MREEKEKKREILEVIKKEREGKRKEKEKKAGKKRGKRGKCEVMNERKLKKEENMRENRKKP